MSSLSALSHAKYVLINRLAVPLGGFVVLITIAQHSDRLLGQYALVMSFYYVMQMLPLLGLTSFVMREVARAPREAGSFFVTIGVLSMFGCVAVDVFSYVFLHFADYDASVVRAIGVVAVLIFPGILAFIAEIVCISVHRAKPVALVAVAENVLRVAASAILLFMDYGIVELVIVLCFTRLGALFSYIVIMQRSGVVERFGPPSRALFRRTLNILPVFLWGSIVLTLLSRLDFFVLSLFKHVEVLGYYAIGYRLFEIFVIVLTGLVMAIFPWVSKQFVSARKRYLVSLRIIVTASTGALVLLAVFGALFAEYYVLLLFPEQYPAPVTLSRLFAVALLFAGLDFVASGILHASDQQVQDIRATTIGGALLCSLLPALVPSWGVYGAFLAKVLATILQSVLKFIAIQKNVGVVYSSSDAWRLLGLMLLCGVPAAFALEAPLSGKLLLSVALVLLVLLYMLVSGAAQPLRLLRFYRRPRVVEDVSSVSDLIDMLIADERRGARDSRAGNNKEIGLPIRRNRAATVSYRVSRFLYLNGRERLSLLVTRLNAALNHCSISAAIKAGPGLLIKGYGNVRANEDIGTNVTLGG